ncbi:UPF0149 family protein [Luteimonas suaedae]|uniref:UPF0149 family protein n=1 Tax=Luteimonas suaedae TaxID=2605430 RepID=UPI0021066460|nr:UPF0149 family protein [Luteimonas suaedae]
MSNSLPSPRDVQNACRALGLGVSAAELHGGLCGWVAGGGADGPEWLRRVLVDDNLPAPPDEPLEQLRRASVAQLEDRSFGFELLLLPDTEATLYERSGALFDWCRGFLGGFGLAAGQAPSLSEEGSEALADLAKLAAASPQDDGDQEDEAALAELEEFVRVAALLLHGDCALGPRHRQRLN